MFSHDADGNDPKRKRMKNDTDISRGSLIMRSHQEAYAIIKGEQVFVEVFRDLSFALVFVFFYLFGTFGILYCLRCAAIFR